MQIRCEWARDNEREKIYHDQEWGQENHDDQRLFEYLVLESMQAGLSWSTILAKRETLRAAYSDFNYQEIANYNDIKLAELLADSGVIRHKLKIKATVSNAQAFLAIQKEFGSFDAYIWAFVQGQPIINQWQTSSEVPAKTALSDEISQDLKKRGFKFLGSTSIYAFMQSCGLVNDHLVSCFKRK